MKKSSTFFHFIPAYVLFLATLVSFSSRAAQEAPQQFAFEGRLYQVDGITPLTDVVNFKFQILNQNTSGNPINDCVLYEEIQNGVNLGSTSGVFNISVGSGTGATKRSGSDGGLTMAQVFDNSKPITAPAGQCPASPYNPSSGSIRRLRVIVTNTATGVTETMSPDLTVGSVPQAFVAETLQGLGPTDFLKVDGTTPMTEALTFDTWATGGRPSSPVVGSTGFNTTTGYLESWNGSGWVDYSAGSGGGLSGLTSGRVLLSTGSTSAGDSSNLTFNSTTGAMGIGGTAPTISSTSGNLVFNSSSGFVGIGASNPGYALEINGNRNVSLGNNTGNAGGFFTFGVAHGMRAMSGGIEFIVGNNPLMSLPSSNNVGIGTTSPSSKLDVSGTNASGTLRVFDQTATTGITRSIIRAGAGQTTTNLLEIQDNAGTVTGSVNSSGFWLQPGTPTAATNQAATTNYVDSAVSTSGGSYVKKDGSVALTGAWDTGNQALKNISTLSVGTATVPTGGVATFNGNVGIGTTAALDTFSIGTAPVASATRSLVNLSNTALVGGSANGTYLGGNTPSAYTGDFIHFQNNGTSAFKVGSNGTISVGPNAYYSSSQAGLFNAGGDVRVGNGGNTANSTLTLHSGNNATGTDIIFETGGTEKMRIDAYGGIRVSNVGAVGNANLSWVGDGYRLYGQSGASNKLHIESDGNVAIKPGNSEKVTFLANGNVGIGTTTPGGGVGANLHLYKTTSDARILVEAPNNAADIRAKGSTCQTHGFYATGGSNTFSMTFMDACGADSLDFKYNGGSSLLSIKNSGNVGIGTTNPSSPLTIKSSLGGGTYAFAVQNGAGTTVMGIDGPGAIYALSGIRIPNQSQFEINATPSGASAQYPLIKLGGNLGGTAGTDWNNSGTYIGANPASLAGDFINFQVNNVSKFKVDKDGKIYGDGSTLSGVTASAAGSGGQIQFNNGSNSLTADSALHWDNTNKRLGIGTASPDAKLHVASGTILLDNNQYLKGDANSGTDASLAGVDGGYYARYAVPGGLNGFLMGGAGFASLEGDYNTNSLKLSTNNAERVRIDSSGNVGIGTTTPTAKLQVRGTGLDNAGLSDFLIQATGSNGAGLLLDPSPGGAGKSWNILASQTGNSFGLGNGSFAIRDQSVAQNRLVIDTNGNVGIGTASPGMKLDIQATTADGDPLLRVKGSLGASIQLDGAACQRRSIDYLSAGVGKWSIMGNDSCTDDMTIKSGGQYGTARLTILQASGYVGLSNTAPTKILHVGSASVASATAVANFQNADGTCTITPASSGSGIACSSDERLKENFENVEGDQALENILKLQAISYNFKTSASKDRQVGYKAQDVQKIAPQFVREDDNGFLQVYYDAFIPWITESIKSIYAKVLSIDQSQKIQSSKIAELEAQNQQLTKEVQKKSEEVEFIKAWICSKDPNAPVCQK